jgi:hypothetical protein
VTVRSNPTGRTKRFLVNDGIWYRCGGKEKNVGETEMPYIPSEKTNPPANDRKMIDAAVDPLAAHIASKIDSNRALLREYKITFMEIAQAVNDYKNGNVSS